MREHGTYVYCLVAADRKPSIGRGVTGLAGTGPVRLLPLAAKQWLVVADVPLDVYGEGAINKGLSDLDWVSRAAVAHEAIVERFIAATALLPMKLFTIFSSDARALEDVRERRRQIDAVLERVKNRNEWGIRVVLDRTRAIGGTAGPTRGREPSGAGYLSRKKAQRDATAELAVRAREVVDDLYDRVARLSTTARRRVASELPAQGGPLLLDAAFLVPRSRARRVQTAVVREAKRLAPLGYRITLTGPWPPYSFMQE